jgi:hypothetical protein
VEQARLRVYGGRRGEQRVDVDRPGRLTHQRDLARVAAEMGDVVAHELQRLDEVQQREVARVLLRVGARLELRHAKEAEDAEPVVDAHHHGVGGAGQRGAVVHRVGCVARHVAAAVNEHDHRAASARIVVVAAAIVVAALVIAVALGRDPDVEVQAVFAAHGLVQRGADRRVVAVVGARPVNAPVLNAGVAELLREARCLPRLRVGRRLPAQVTDRCLGERHALPRMGAGGGGIVAAHDGAEAGVPLQG